MALFSRWSTFAAAAASAGGALAVATSVMMGFEPVRAKSVEEYQREIYLHKDGAGKTLADKTAKLPKPVDLIGPAEKEKGAPLTEDERNFLTALSTHPYYAWKPTEEEKAKRDALRKKAFEEIAKRRAERASSVELKAAPVAPGLSDKEFRPFTLAQVTDVSHNTKLFRFKLPREYQALGLTVASCLVTKAEIDGKTVIRPYTPTSGEKVLGYFDLIVKTYPEGVMSKHLFSLKPGDSLEMKGPFKKIEYTANMKKAIGMIAGGTGITPMYQVITKILADPRDKTEVRLIFANETADDILLKPELDALAALYPNFKVYYTLSKPPAGWQGFTGYVGKEQIAKVLPPPSDDNLLLVCGPPPMVAAISGSKTKDNQQGELEGVLKTMGYTSAQVFKF